VSSNTVAGPAGDPESTSLARFLAAAQEAGGPGHHFRVLQLPLNLLEPGPLFEPNTGPGDARTVLEHAAEAGVAVLVNRPLNAMADEVMVRLAEAEVPDAPDVEAQARVVAAQELEFRRTIGSRLRAAEGSIPPEQLFRWADDLGGVAQHVRSLEHWDQLESQRILPRLVQVLQALDQGLTGEAGEAWQAWRSAYLPELQKLLAAHRRRAAEISRERTGAIGGVLAAVLPPERVGESLSRKAVWVAASAPGVTSVLVGMRQPEYVDDALAVLEWEPLADAGRAFEVIRATTA
ncbi:MAG TPA: hypothetical protein VFO85_19975, partial [Vicinamibacteria bacterium]|nr:hypothetical protein [Vicinamibacteria bacterium]